MSSTQHLAHVARGGAVGLAGAAISAAAAFLLVVVVTNQYDADTAGMFFAATSALLLLGAIATLGTDAGLGRFILRFEAIGRRDEIPAVVRAAARPVLLVSLSVAIAVFVFAEPLGDLIGLDSDEGRDSLRVLAVALPFLAAHELALSGTRAFGKMKVTALVDGVVRSGSQPVAVLAVSLAATGLVAITAAFAVPYAIAALISVLMLRALLRRRGPYAGAPDERAVRREFWSFTWPRTLTKIAQIAIQRVDILIIAALRSPTEAAVYTAATRFVPLGQIGTQAIQQVVQPKFTALIATDDHPALKSVFQVSTAWSMAISWPVYLIVGCAPLVYLGLFGEQYVDDGMTVVILMTVAMLFGIASGPADVLLLMSGRSLLSLVNAAVALALDVILCFVLVPEHGIVGAAIAWAVAVITRCTLALVQVHRYLEVSSVSRATIVVAAAGLAGLAFPIVVIGALVELNVGILALVLAACLPVYAGLLYLGRYAVQLTGLRAALRSGSADG